MTYHFDGPFGQNTAGASVTRSISEEKSIAAEDPPFLIRRDPAPKQGLANVISKFLPRKRMEGSSWVARKSLEEMQRGPREGRDNVKLAPRSKSYDSDHHE